MVNLDVFKPFLNVLLGNFRETDPDFHESPNELIPLLEELNALQGLPLGRLVQLNREVDVLHGCLDGLQCKVATVGGVHALLGYDSGNVSLHVGYLEIPLFVADLQLAYISLIATFLQDNFDNLVLGLVGEELVEVGLFGDGAVIGIFVDLAGLQNFADVLFEAVAPVDCFVAVAGDLEQLVVDLVLDEGDVGHLHHTTRLFQHSFSFIIAPTGISI